jgi:hypothetical protein
MGETKIYRQKNLTFIVSPQRITVRTSLPQTFFLEPRQHYWKKRVALIAMMIELNEIRTLNELAEWTRPGVDWVSTRVNYPLENEKEVVYNH